MELVGCVDIVTRYSVVGWAADRLTPDREVGVLIWIDDQLVGRVNADQLRLDLQRLGLYGTGRHGFTYTFEDPLPESLARQVRVTFANSEQAIPQRDVVIEKSGDARGPAAHPAEPQPPAAAGAAPTAKSPPLPENMHFIVHIGPHKTASSYLQVKLKKLEASLQDQEFFFPGFWSLSEGNPSHHALFERLKAENETQLAQDFHDVRQNGSSKIIISSEDLVDLPVPSIELLKKLIGSSKVTIVYYVRRWSAKLVSNWKENLLNGATVTLPEYLSANLANPLASATINFSLTLNKFANAFGRENLRLVSYDDLVETNTDFASHFVSNFVDENLGPFEKSSRIHKSSDFIDAEIIRVLNVLAKNDNLHPGAGRQFFRHRKFFDADRVRQLMGGFVKTMVFREDAPLLRQILVSAFSDFGDALVEPKPKHSFFRAQAAEYKYVTSDYLLQPNVHDVIADLRSQITSRA